MSCFHLSNGAFGNKIGSWDLGFVGLAEGASLVWRWVRKGVLHRRPWENRLLSSCGKRVTTKGIDLQTRI
jgi:hypothetical protein